MPLNEELRQFVKDNFMFGKDNGGLADTDSFLDKGIIDSTGVLELVAFLEERYGIHVQDRDLVPENLDSIQNLATFIGSRMPKN
jgi:acyl carrier protein